ncbi:Glutathione S-transferase [Cyphomyrmex costatus]|uniref:glutathione transferase n=1 Tax=Cyphomyrmex costatus TaxID=456900 RepID=A0A195CW83_9HYME|nr:Glutathione S-transferase [Cyphomyrmex costatus]
MSTYKLKYLNATGVGEPIRFLLNYCGIKFEDIRISFDDWPKYKPDMPMGQVPVLEIDGKQYHQSRAIGRFIAKKGNLYGSDDFEAMEIDAVVDSIEDIRQAMGHYYLEQNPVFKAKLKEIVFQKLYHCRDKFEEQIKKNGGYFVGGKLSWADFQWAGHCDILRSVLATNPNEDHPELNKLTEKVRDLPKIKAYTMSMYKLTYFKDGAVGEPSRYLLSYCGIEFEDIRLTNEEWPKHKPDMPMGQLPILKIDDKIYHQSRAIARFIAKKGNLYGSNEFEAMEIDATVDSMEDIRRVMGEYYWEQDPIFKANLKKIAFQKLLFYLDKFEAQVKNNGGYFVNSKLSWPDFMWAAYSERLSFILTRDVNQDHPELKKLIEKIRALPKVKAYIEKRPKI